MDTRCCERRGPRVSERAREFGKTCWYLVRPVAGCHYPRDNAIRLAPVHVIAHESYSGKDSARQYSSWIWRDFHLPAPEPDNHELDRLARRLAAGGVAT